MDLKALFKGLFGHHPRSRFSQRRVRYGWPASAIESLEQRVLPAYVTIVGMPTYSTTGIGEVTVDTYTDPDTGLASWYQQAKVQLPEEGVPFGTYETGSYESTGDLVFKVNAEGDDLVGCPVIITLSFTGRVFWSDDPVGVTNTSTFRTTAGVDSPDEMVDLSGGHLSGDARIGQSYLFSNTGYTKEVQTTIGGTVTVHVHQDGYSEPWKDFNPQAPGNVLETITTGVVDAALSVAVVEVNSLQAEIDAGTFDDDLPDDDLMGPYLENVDYAVDFFTYLQQELEGEYEVTTAKWEIGSSTGNLTVTDGVLGDLKFNPKNLAPGNYQLKITGYDTKGRPIAVTRKELKINVIDELDYGLQVKGKDGALIDVDDARFFEGIKAEVTFIGTLKDLPSYYGSFNPTKPQPHVFLNGVDTEVDRISEHGDPVYKFQFTYDVSTLPVKDVLVDLKIGNVPISYFGDEAEKIHVVKKPTWLTAGKPTFDEDTVEYKWTQTPLGLLKVDAPQLPKTGQSWLDAGLSGAKSARSARAVARFMEKKASSGSSSSVTLDVYLNVVASIDTTIDPTYEGTKLVGKATLLGHEIWNKTYTAGDVKIGGELDAKTLDPQSFSVSLARPITVNQFTLTEARSFKINLLKKAFPVLPEWIASVNLKGSVGATQGTVNVNGAILLKKEGDSVVLDSTGTFLGLDQSTINGSGSIGINGKLAKGYLGELDVTGTVKPQIVVTLLAKFSGPFSSPRFAGVNFQVSAKLKYELSASLTTKLGGEGLHWSTADNGTEDDFLGPYKLVDYKGN